MAISLLTGPANAGKAQVVVDAVRAHLAHGEEPLLVVPTRADAEHYMRELAGEGAALGARVERFGGLIGEAVARAGTAAPLLGAVAREQLLAALAGRSQLDASGPGLVRALGEVIAELQVRRVSPARLGGALREWAAQDGPTGASGALGWLYGEYLRALQRLGRVDSEQRALGALDALRRAPALWGLTPVLFYGFDDLTHLQLDAIETLGRVVGAPVTVSLTYEPGRTAFAGRAATFAALAPIADEHRRLAARADHYAPRARAALSHLERSLFEARAQRAQEAAGALRLLEGGGERAELELVADEVATLLAAGMAPHEIAVVARAPGVSAELLAEVFAAKGIAHTRQRRRRLADTAVGRALVGALRCAADAGTLGDLLAWLRAPGLLEHPELADRLELQARRAGATSAMQARALWERRHWPLATIDQLTQAAQRGPVTLIARAERELQWLFCAPRLRAASVLGVDELDEARALSAGRRALGELRELARADPQLVPADAGGLARWLEGVEIVSGEGGGWGSPTGTVAVLDPLSLLDAGGGRRVRALFVCGLQEGVFPARQRPQPFLAEEERRRLAEASGLLLGERADALAAERYLLYAIVSRPQELLVLSWHAADDDGEPTARSLFVDDVCDLFADDLLDRRTRRSMGAADRMDVAGGHAAGATPAEGATPADDATPAEGATPTDGATLADGAIAVARSAKLTDARLLEQLRDHVWSASSLEVWIACPVRWFVERLLRPGALDPDPEPFARGGLAHAALKDTLEGLARERGSARLTPASLARARELLHASLRDNEAAYPLSVAPERVPGVRRRLVADLERYMAHAAAAQSPLEPTQLELGFGFDGSDERGGASELAALELGDGVRMRGRIDRVDTDDSGQAVVYDYKGRVAPPAARWVSQGSLQVALYMRAVERLLGLRAVGGFYQPLAGGDLRARGVLDQDSGVALECVRGDAREHAEVRELLDEAVATALAAAAQAARGDLRPQPRTCSYDGGCAYPTICRCER
jgi:ATP-dependent helicase/DNAse subunit B